MLDSDESQEKVDFDAEPLLEVYPQPPPEPEASSHAIHLLDQDSEVLLYLFDLLTEAGYRVRASSIASDALEHVARWQPEILIASLEMPELPGSELLSRVMLVAPFTRVLWTSEQTRRTDFKKALRGQDVDLIAKPIDGARVLKVLEKLLVGS